MKVLARSASRRTLLQSFGFGAVGATGFALVGCGNDDDDDMDDMMDESPTMGATETMEPMETMEPTAMADPTDTPAMDDDDDEAMMGDATHPLITGWYRGDEVRYYDFGMNSPVSGNTVTPAPIWAFITGMDDDGNPVFVEGQHTIIDAVPGDMDYSDLWEVQLVTVPEDYEPDSIRSRDEVEMGGYEITPPGIYVNCPVVEADAMLEGGEELVQGWYRGEEVFYPDFGPNPPAAIPIWAFATGMDDDGNPLFVEGQHNIIDAVPGDMDYSAFWRVNLVMVDDSYEPDSLRSADDVASAMWEVTETDLVVNCPVVEY